MTKSYQKVFAIFVLGLLFLPLGYMLGGKEKTRLAGVDPQTELPSLQTTKFKTKQFQQQFEKWWQSHFLYRKIALKLKNQLYDWANFGQFHAGYNKTIVQGKKGQLIRSVEIQTLYNKQCVLPKNEVKTQLKRIHNYMKERGKRMFFIIAPDSASTYPNKIPIRYSWFKSGECQAVVAMENMLKESNIPYFNVRNLFRNIGENTPYPLYPRTGTHWAPYGQVVAMQKILEEFNLGTIAIEKVQTKARPDAGERDIADLLNLIFPYRVKDETYYTISSKASVSFPGTVAAIGDSYTGAFWQLANSGFVKRSQFTQNGNRDISFKEAENFLNTDLVFFVFIASNLSAPNVFGYKNIDAMYNAAMKEFRYNFGDRDENRWTLEGISHFESPIARWSEGPKTSIAFAVKKRKNYKITFKRMGAFVSEQHPVQSADIFINGIKMAEWTFEFAKRWPKTELNVAENQIGTDNKIVIEFRYKNAISPKELGKSDDDRKLAFLFTDMELE